MHDETVAKDYYTAIHWVEKRMAFSFSSQEEVQAFTTVLQRRLLLVAEQLKESELTVEARLVIVDQLCCLMEIGAAINIDSG